MEMRGTKCGGCGRGGRRDAFAARATASRAYGGITHSGSPTGAASALGEAGSRLGSARVERPAQLLQFLTQRGNVAFETFDAVGEIAARRRTRFLHGRGSETLFIDRAAKEV